MDSLSGQTQQQQQNNRKEDQQPARREPRRSRTNQAAAKGESACAVSLSAIGADHATEAAFRLP
jgi:hypothetical protein